MSDFKYKSPLRVKAKQHRDMAKQLLIWSAKLEAVARLIDEGIESPSTELIEQEAGGTRPGPEPLTVTREEYAGDPGKYTGIAIKEGRAVAIVDDQGKRTAIISAPRRPLGLGYDLNSCEDIR